MMKKKIFRVLEILWNSKDVFKCNMGVNLSSPQKSIGASLSILGMKSDRFD